MFHKYFTALTFILFSISAYAQSPLKFGIFVGISNPMGDFGDNSIAHSLYSDDIADEGPSYAKLGFAGGVELTYPLGAPGLGWYSSAALIYNSFDDDAIKQLYEHDGWQVNSVDVGNWMNIQVASGLNYTTALSPAMDFLVMGQLALTFVNPPTTTVEYEGYYSSYEYDIGTEEGSLESTSSLGFIIGAGLVFNNKFNVSVRYLGLGNAEMDASRDDRGTWYDTYDQTYGDYHNTGSYKIKRSISMVLLTVGMTF